MKGYGIVFFGASKAEDRVSNGCLPAGGVDSCFQ